MLLNCIQARDAFSNELVSITSKGTSKLKQLHKQLPLLCLC